MGSASPEQYWPEDVASPASRPQVRRLALADLSHALADGMADFGAFRTDVLFLCVIYPLVGLALARLASGYGMLPLIFPLASGFALIGPFAAVGLIEMSRQREQGLEIGWAGSLDVYRSPAFGKILLLGFGLLVVFLFWLVAAQGIYELTLGPKPPVSIGRFAHDVFATPAGWVMIVAGVGVGFLFAVLVLTTTVVAFPMLLDRNVSLETATRTSIQVVAVNPEIIAVWGMIVTAGLVLGSIPLLLGLIVIMPVLGHATWHLYRRAVPH
jgi:uncharacterized membrane protein